MVATILVIFHWGDFSKVTFGPYARFFSVQRGAWPKWPNGKHAYVTY